MRLTLSILILCSASITLAVYNPIASYDYLTASILTYSTPSDVLSWTCGAPCQNLTGYRPYYSNVFNISANESLAFSMIYQPCTRKFVTAFRGTDSEYQLELEESQAKNVTYNLTNISGAEAVEYFYNGYTQLLRETFLQKIKNAFKSFPMFQFIFTGHSLGAALATLASFDAVTSGYLPARHVAVYNFGSPRVGNQALANAITKAIPDFYRVVHWEDIVPHLPPCVTSNVTGQCVPHTKPGNDRWPVWHAGQEIFYNEAMTNYTVCKEPEDPKCSDQFSLNDTTFRDHFFYLGRVIGIVDNATADVSIIAELDALTKKALGLDS